MQNIVDQIRYDHISMSRILLLTEHELVKLKSEGSANFSLVGDCMRYMIEYTEAVHHPKEDAMMDCIYGKLTEIDTVIDEVKLQHGSMGKKSAEFYNIVRSAIMEQFEEKSNIVALGRDYVNMQRSHIRLEEGGILRRLKTLLTTDDIVKINQQYSENCDPQIKDNFEEEYNSLYRSLIAI